MECMSVFWLTRRQGTRMLVLTAIHKNAQYFLCRVLTFFLPRSTWAGRRVEISRRTELWTDLWLKKYRGKYTISLSVEGADSRSVFQLTGSPNAPYTLAQVMSTCIERSEKLRRLSLAKHHLFNQIFLIFEA